MLSNSMKLSQCQVAMASVGFGIGCTKTYPCYNKEFVSDCLLFVNII